MLTKMYNLLLVVALGGLTYFIYKVVKADPVEEVVEAGKIINETWKENKNEALKDIFSPPLAVDDRTDEYYESTRRETDNKIINFLQDVDINMHKQVDKIQGWFNSLFGK